ncbi:fumarylacetoacetate hydrolase family protein [Plantactinospora solaniradicis]|uniref:Fumarylacetoacetate hydrolase family protein n=1 Tax=Plantactinospora solaniradicis TaxID=1723736 RepID=A0ABW1KP30_9ACTN
MKLCLFDDYRTGAVVDGGIVDLTASLPWPHDPDPETVGSWRRLCRDYAELADRLADAVAQGPVVPLDRVRLRAPALNPSKIIAAASNYAEHVHEMHAVQERTLGKVEEWMMSFDVFLKAPSSLAGPEEPIVLPAAVLAAGHEVHHESELVVVIGKGGRDIPAERAREHILGYSIGLDITVRSPGDRSRRKSYDTFSPLGPWLTTADEAGPDDNFEIELLVNGEERQRVNTADLIVAVPAIVEHASRVMTLSPGDLIFTGAPPGVGPIHPGDVLAASISGLGVLRTSVTAGSDGTR